jgi:membrane-bound inhibitor of C-type lysozyme
VKKLIVLMFLLVSFMHLAHAQTLQRQLGVKLLGVGNYQCADKTKLNVRYYRLSDNSLDFIKLKLNAKTYTLPQAVSASGVKYSDDMVLTWWSKGSESTVYEQNGGPEENWPATHENCIEVKTKN